MEKEMIRSNLSKVTSLVAFFAALVVIVAACTPAVAVPNTGGAKTVGTPTTPVGMMLAGTLTSGMNGLAAFGTVMLSNSPKLGDFLVDPKGMTLYVYSKDTAGVSNCAGDCLASWPALVATGDMMAGAGVSGKLGEITRADGTKQVTYNDMPLYTFSGDKSAGDTTGQGVGGVWLVAPATSKPASTSSGTGN
jgi:predicted lipoprotein with Yx(FWY)xxD motif